MENNEKNQNEIINLQNHEKNEEDIEKGDEEINNSFCSDFSGIIGLDVFKEECKDELKKNKSKDTVLDQKIINKIPKKSKISQYIQINEINDLENSLKISLLEEQNNKKKENEYLSIRTFPHYDLNEYDKIKKNVGKNLLNISSFLLEKKLKLNFNEINTKK